MMHKFLSFYLHIMIFIHLCICVHGSQVTGSCEALQKIFVYVNISSDSFYVLSQIDRFSTYLY